MSNTTGSISSPAKRRSGGLFSSKSATKSPPPTAKELSNSEFAALTVDSSNYENIKSLMKQKLVEVKGELSRSKGRPIVLVRQSEPGVSPVRFATFQQAAEDLPGELIDILLDLGADSIELSVALYERGTKSRSLKLSGGSDGVFHGTVDVMSASAKSKHRDNAIEIKKPGLTRPSDKFRRSWAPKSLMVELCKVLDRRYEQLVDYARNPDQAEEFESMCFNRTMSISTSVSSEMLVTLAAADGPGIGVSNSKDYEFTLEISLNVPFTAVDKLACLKQDATRLNLLYGKHVMPLLKTLKEIKGHVAAEGARHQANCTAHAEEKKRRQSEQEEKGFMGHVKALFVNSEEPAPLIQPILLLFEPLYIFSFGSPGSCKTSFEWALQMAAEGVWAPPSTELSVRRLPPHHETGGTLAPTRHEAFGCDEKLGLLRIVAHDESGGPTQSRPREYDPANPMHVCVLVASAKELWLTREASDGILILNRICKRYDMTPQVILVTKFDEIMSPVVNPGETSQEELLHRINEAAKQWGEAEYFCDEYAADVASKAINSKVRVVPFDAPVRVKNSEQDPRKLDPPSLRILLDRTMHALHQISLAVLDQVEAKVCNNTH